MRTITRRTAARLLFLAPAAAAAAQQPAAPPASAFGACIAAAEPSLSPDERARVEKSIASLEASLQTIRDFRLPPGADPAMQFRPMRSRRSGR